MWESIREPLSANRRIVRNDYPPVKDTNKHSDINFFYPISIYSFVFRYSFYIFFFFIYLSLPCRVTHASFTYFSFSFIYISCLYFYSLFHIISSIFLRFVFANLLNRIIYICVKYYEFENNFANTVIT